MAKKKKGNKVTSILGKVITTEPSKGNITEDVVKLIGMTVDIIGFGEITQNIINPWLEDLRLMKLDVNKTSNKNDLLALQKSLTKDYSYFKKLFDEETKTINAYVESLEKRGVKVDKNNLPSYVKRIPGVTKEFINKLSKKIDVVISRLHKIEVNEQQEQINLIKRALSQYYEDKFKNISDIANKRSNKDKISVGDSSIVKTMEYYNKSLDSGIALLDQYKKYIEKLQPTTPKSGKPPGRASGGPVRINSMYLVGEAGPELFIPDSNGTIISNANLTQSSGNSSGGNITIDTVTCGTIIGNIIQGSFAQATGSSNSDNPNSKEEKARQKGGNYAQFIPDAVKSNLMPALTTAFKSGNVPDAIKSFTDNLGESTRSKALDDLSNSIANSSFGQNLQNWYGKLTGGLNAGKNKALSSVLDTVGNWASGAAAGGMGSGAMLGSALGTIWGPMGSTIGGMLGGLFGGGNSSNPLVIAADNADLKIDFAEANFKTVTLPGSYQSKGTTSNTNSAAPVINVNVNVAGGINGDRELERKIKQIGTAAAVEVQKTVSKWSGYTVNGVSSSLAGG